MAITRKQQKFIDEYFVDLNASAAAVRAGYAEASARQQGSRLLSNVDIKLEIARRMKVSKLTADDVVKALGAMALGATPTKIVEGSHSREEYDLLSAMEKVGKVFALFVDKSIVEIDNLDIVDEEE